MKAFYRFYDKRTPAPQAHSFNHGLGAANK